MDPREERSARILRDALFDLARTRDIASVTPTELSRVTGLARRTIYNHGIGPQELLFGYLAEELTAIRDQLTPDADTHTARESFETGLDRVLAHVQNHRAIYTQAVSATTSPAWHHLLTQHFRVSLMVFCEHYPLRLPGAGRAQIVEAGSDVGRVIASALAHEMVGAIEAWLRLEPAPEPGFCQRLIMALTPEWFLGEGSD